MTKNQKIIRISRILIDTPMPISPMKKNTTFGIIEEERSSARETVCRVVAGALAKQALSQMNVRFSTYVIQIGNVKFESESFFDSALIEDSSVRCPDKKCSKEMEDAVLKIKGDTLGGIVQCIVENVESGLGEPVFDKLHAELGKAMLSNAVKGFETGSGFSAASMKALNTTIFLTIMVNKTNYSVEYKVVFPMECLLFSGRV